MTKKTKKLIDKVIGHITEDSREFLPFMSLLRQKIDQQPLVALAQNNVQGYKAFSMENLQTPFEFKEQLYDAISRMNSYLSANSKLAALAQDNSKQNLKYNVKWHLPTSPTS